MSKKQNGRKTPGRPRAPDIHLQAPSVDQGSNATGDALLQMARELGRVAGALEGVQAGLVEVKNDVKDIRDTQQEQALKNEQAHSDMKRDFENRFSALGEELAVAVAVQKNTPPAGASAGRKEEDTLTKADRLFKFAKEWGPVFMKGAAYVLAALGTLWGAMYAYASTVATKGTP